MSNIRLSLSGRKRIMSENKEMVNKEIVENVEKNLVDIAEDLLLDADRDFSNKEKFSMPIASLSSFGAAVTSMIPALNTVTEVTTATADGLYRLANAEIGDTLKVAKNGNFWGAFKTAENKSKFAQLTKADTLDATEVTSTINPATMMMAVAIYQMNQKLDEIEKTQKQIFDFMRFEKESKIEANLETLLNIIKRYKFNWDSELFTKNNHKEALEIQKNALSDMKFYQKQVQSLLPEKRGLVSQKNVEKLTSDLDKSFVYYRMSLYTYALASMVEVMLDGNFGEENIGFIKSGIEKEALEYRDYFRRASECLEDMSNGAIDTKIVKGIGNVGRNVGKFIGNIPVIEKGPIDEALQKGGTRLADKAEDTKTKAVHTFASLGDPGTVLITDRLQDMIRIYNHTESICFDNERIYLIAN